MQWDWLNVNENSALVIVDVQNGFINPYTANIPTAVESLLEDKLFKTVIAAKFINSENSLMRRLTSWHKLTGPPKTNLLDFIENRSDYVVEKNIFNASEAVYNILKPLNIDTVYLCGINTDICVLQTAVGLFEKNIIPFILTDACATSSSYENHDNGLKILKRTIGRQQLLSKSLLFT